MRFLGKAWKVLVGIKDALVLIFMLIFFGGLYAALSASPHEDSAERGALRLELSGAIVEQPSQRNPFDLVGGTPVTRQYRVSELIHALDTAAADDDIQAVALDLDLFTGGGQTAIANVGEALDRVRRADKRVVAYATGYSDDTYQLAAHADEIWLDPPAAITAAGGDMAQAALRAGLVDRIGGRAQFGQRMAELAGTDDPDEPDSYRAVHYDAWIDDHPASDSGGEIAVLTVAGEIVDSNAPAGTAGGETVAGNLERGLERGDIKALVVRIDSPGGSVTASERIRRAVVGAKRRGIPVVVSMGSVAASGGYWIATAGDVIFAEPSTITGSIGVFGILPSFQGTLEKLGVGADGVRTTPLSGEPDLLRGPSPHASQLLQRGVETTYRRFIGLVSRSRHLPPARVNEIAQGRVWDGGTARQLGLVDRFGSLDDAIAEAARRAHIDPADAQPRFLEREPGWLGQILADAARDEEDQDDQARDAFARLAHRPEIMIQRALHDAQQLLSGPAIQARCLECPPIAPAPRAAAGGSLWTQLMAMVWRG